MIVTNNLSRNLNQQTYSSRNTDSVSMFANLLSEETQTVKTGRTATGKGNSWCADLIEAYKNGKRDFGVLMGGGISTDKPMNWDADGSAQLTEEQIEYLKSTYDLTNMSKQDYYNFMADLTNMNVISAEDVVSQYVAPLPIGPGQLLTTSMPQSVLSASHTVGGSMGSSGNLYDNLSQYMQALDVMMEWLTDNHTTMESTMFYAIKDYLDYRSSLYEKYQDIFELME